MFNVGLIEKNAGLLLAWRFLLLISLFLGCIILPAHGFERYTAHGGPVRGASLSPDGKMLVTASFDYSAVVWKAKALEEHTTLLGHEAAVNTAEFSPNGKVWQRLVTME